MATITQAAGKRGRQSDRDEPEPQSAGPNLKVKQISMSRTCLSLVISFSLACVPLMSPTAEAVDGRPQSVGEQEQLVAPVRMTAKHLPNPVQIHSRVISGGLPQGEAAFQELSELGVKTIISVDGAKPDVTTARKFGLRYIHLPHGYNGIPEKRVKELAKAVRDLEGTIYIHCHHGKHRSPAAASVACVTAGLLPASAALLALELAGTSHNYRGLYRSAEQARRITARELDELEVGFREVVDVPPMAEAMVVLEHTHDHLKLIQQAGWETPAEHPDLDPAHEALLLREHFTELLRTDEVKQQTRDFRKLLERSEADARQLHAELRQWQQRSDRATPPSILSRFEGRIAENCRDCHQAFRDTPLEYAIENIP